MKIFKGILYSVLAIAGLALFSRFFLAQMEGGGMAPKDGPVGVLFSPPPGYSMVEANEVVPTSAASELETTASAPGASKVGVRFRHEGAQIYWLADLETDQLEEHSAGASGTRLQTIWRGNLRQRLAYAKTHGTFEVPGLPAGERVNLYH